VKFWSHEAIAARLAIRPPEYAAELERFIVKREAGGVWLDVDHAHYAAFAAKYSRPPEPIASDFDVEAERRRLKGGGCCGQPSQQE
jgi:hypothetical protein